MKILIETTKENLNNQLRKKAMMKIENHPYSISQVLEDMAINHNNN